jgi:glutamate racemase
LGHRRPQYLQTAQGAARRCAYLLFFGHGRDTLRQNGARRIDRSFVSSERLLETQGVTQLVIGCNAASTALPWLQVPGLKVAGVIESAVQLTASLRPARLALIGGRRTVLSGVYRRAFAARGIGVAQRIAQPLSALIESGDVSSAELRAQCRRILMPVKGCSHLLLACTHYPAIAPVLQEFMAAETVLINPASALVTQIERWPLPVGGADVFLTTGAPAGMKRAAWQAFGVRLQAVRQLKL